VTWLKHTPSNPEALSVGPGLPAGGCKSRAVPARPSQPMCARRARSVAEIRRQPRSGCGSARVQPRRRGGLAGGVATVTSMYHWCWVRTRRNARAASRAVGWAT
jgi:hypothetical protein